MTRVVNLRKEKYDVYIGRAGKEQEGYFGNPFSSGTREQNIADFRIYFENRLWNDPEFRVKVIGLKGKRLGCFCKPKACHGDVIVEFIENYDQNSQP